MTDTGTRIAWSGMTPQEKVELIKRLYGQDGGSMSEIAARLSMHLKYRVSRSAVVGVYQRNPDLQRTHPFTGVRMSKAVAKTLDALPLAQRPPRLPRVKKVKLTPRAKPEAPPQAPLALMGEPKSRELTLMELERDSCRWPTSTEPFRFCGCQTVRLSSYCTFHHARSWESAAAARLRRNSA